MFFGNRRQLQIGGLRRQAEPDHAEVDRAGIECFSIKRSSTSEKRLRRPAKFWEGGCGPTRQETQQLLLESADQGTQGRLGQVKPLGSAAARRKFNSSATATK